MIFGCVGKNQDFTNKYGNLMGKNMGYNCEMVGYIANVAEQYGGFQRTSSQGDPHNLIAGLSTITSHYYQGLSHIMWC
jgi:hypothetical protein